MKKIFLIIFNMVTFSSLISFSQNLVPNPSYEEFSECPDTSSLVFKGLLHWYTPTLYSPDYFNECDTNTPYGAGVPMNWYGYQSARTGVAYVGIILEYGPGDNQREYIQVKLLDSLKSGKSYIVSFFVALADSSPYAVNDIGAYLSKTPIAASNTNNLPYQPQIANNPLVNPLNIPDVWIEVKDTFISQGQEQYITIGNFKDDASTDTTHIHDYSITHENSSYKYIEDVSVVCIDCNVGVNNASFRKKVKISTIARGKFNIFSDDLIIESIQIYSLLGQEVFAKKSINHGSIFMDFSQYLSGIYFIKLKIGNNFWIEKIIIN